MKTFIQIFGLFLMTPFLWLMIAIASSHISYRIGKHSCKTYEEFRETYMTSFLVLSALSLLFSIGLGMVLFL